MVLEQPLAQELLDEQAKQLRPTGDAGLAVDGIALRFHRTLLRLLPARTLSCTRSGGVGLKRYWPRANAQGPKLTQSEWTEAMIESFGKALPRRWDSSDSNAAFLSGGVDSALMVAGLRELLGSEVDTFAIGYEAYQGRNDERAIARANAQTLGTHHHEIAFGPQDIIV